MADGSIKIDVELDNSGVKKGIAEIEKAAKNIKMEGVDGELKKANGEAEKLTKSLKGVDTSKIKKDINGLDGSFRSANMSMTKEFEQAAKKSETSISTMKTKMQGHLSGIGSMAKTGLMGLTTAISGVGAAGIGIGGAIAKIGSDFESQMSRVKAISGATTEEFAKLQEQAIQLGAETSFSSREAAEGMENLASAGFTTNEIMAAMPGMLDLAASSGEDLASSSDIAASALRGFGLDADQAGHVADVLAKNASATNAAVGDTGEALKYIAPVAHSMGLSIEEVTAAIGEMANSGIKGSQSGTTLRSSLTRLASPSKEAAGAMKEIGFNAYDSQGKLKNLSTIIDEYGKSLEGKTDKEKQDLTATIFGQEAMSGMLVLMQGGKKGLDDLTNSYKNSDGAAKEMAATMKDNLKGSIDQLTGSLESLGLQLYYSVDNPMKGVVDSANKMVSQMSDAFKKGGFEGLTESMGSVFAQIITGIAQNTPKIIKGAVNVIKSFVKGIKDNANEITKGATDIVTELVSGIIELTPQLIDVGLKIVANLAKGIGDNMPTIIPKIVELVKGIVKAITDNLPDIIQGGVSLATGITQGLIASIPEIIKAIPEINIALLNAVKNTDWVNIGKEIVKSMFMAGATDGANFAEWAKVEAKKIKEAFKNGGLKEVALQISKDCTPGVSADALNFVTWAKAEVKKIKETFKNGGLKEVAKQINNDILPGGQTANKFVTWAKSETTKIKEAFKNGGLKAVAKQIETDIIPGGQTNGKIAIWVKSKILEAKQEIDKLKTELPQKFNEIMAKVKETIANKFNEIKQNASAKAQEIIEGVATWFQQLPSRIASSLGEATGQIGRWGVDVWNYLQTNVPKWIDGIITWFQTLPSRLDEWLNTTINNVVTWGGNMASQMGVAAEQAINAVITWFQQLPSRVEEWFNNTIQQATTFGDNMGTEATNAGKKFFDDLVTQLEQIPSKMGEIGGHIVAGLKNGISESWSNMTGWLGGLCNDFITGVNKKFEVHSPSRVFKRLGGFIMEGWQIGLSDNTNSLINTAENISQSVIDAVNKPVKNANLADNMLSNMKVNTSSMDSLKNTLDMAQIMVDDANKLKVNSNTTQEMIDNAKETAKKQLEIETDKKNKLIKLSEAVTTAKKAQLEEEKTNAINAIDTELKAAEDASTKKLSLMETEYNAQVANIEKTTNSKTKALDAQIAVLEEETQAETRSDERKASKNNINKLTTMQSNTKSQADKDSLQLQINDAKKELNSKENTWDIEDQRAELEAEKTALAEKTEVKKLAMQKDYEAKKVAEEASIKATQEAYAKQKEATEAYYTKLLETEALNIQVRYAMINTSNEDLVKLLNSYAPQWQDAGQSLGDSLLNGLNSSKQSVADAVSEMGAIQGKPPTAINGYASGTSNAIGGFHYVDEEDFELSTSNNSVAYVTEGAGIKNHMQSLVAIKAEISKQVSPLFNQLKSVLYSDQARTANMLSNAINTVNNTNNRGGDINFNVENFNNDRQSSIADISNELGSYQQRQKVW